LYIGHEGHDEALGVLAECPDSIALVEDQATARTITPPDREKLVYLTQTTLSVDETDQIVATLKERFPDLEAPPKEDICYATTNRQRAVKELARQCELILVLGSSNSSNSQRLRECAQGQGTTAYLIDSYRELDPSWLSDVRSVGITAGASAPESAVQDLVRHLSQLSPEAESREVELVQEDMYFPVPDIAAKLQDSPKPTQVATS
jgi:4-hydroxy-3-methylbut-2-enyl diphosphate reductase